MALHKSSREDRPPSEHQMLMTRDDQDDLTDAMTSAFTNQDQMDEVERAAQEDAQQATLGQSSPEDLAQSAAEAMVPTPEGTEMTLTEQMHQMKETASKVQAAKEASEKKAKEDLANKHKNEIQKKE